MGESATQDWSWQSELKIMTYAAACTQTIAPLLCIRISDMSNNALQRLKQRRQSVILWHEPGYRSSIHQ